MSMNHPRCVRSQIGAAGLSEGDTMGETEADRFTRALESRGLNRNQLAIKSGVTATAVARWVKALTKGTVKPEMWRTIATALRRVGIDPAEIRPDQPPLPQEAISLIPQILAVQDRMQLELLASVIAVDTKSERVALAGVVAAQLKLTGGNQ